MNEEQLTPIVEELTKVLDGKASREEIEEQVLTYANVYKVEDPRRIKEAILRKHGMGPTVDTSFVTADHVCKKIADLRGNENRVDILAKVVFAENRTATIKGSQRKLVSGILGDETGTASFTVWDGENCSLEKGSVYRFRNAYTKLWNDKVQINIGNNGTIAKEDVQIDVPGSAPAGNGPANGMKMKIADLKGSEPNVDLEVKAIAAERRTVNIRGETKEIISGTIGDETGTAQFTVWEARGANVEEGKSYTFLSAYTKLWNDQVQVNIGNKGAVEPLDREIITTSSPIMPKPAAPAPGLKSTISGLTGSESNVDIHAKILSAEKKDVVIKGENRSIISGTLGDETGTAQFTVWDAGTIDLETGSVYLIKNAYTKLWNDRIQVNLGNKCTVEKEDREMEVAERKIEYSSSVAKVRDLKEGIGSVTVSGKILSVETRTINSRGEDKTVWSGLLADETGKIQFSAWNDFGLAEGEAVRIENAYIRGWKGIPQLNIGDRSKVDKIDDTFGDVSSVTATKKTVGEIVRTGGGLDMCVSGTVIDIRAGSGVIKRCPECNRSILSNECITHGTVEPVQDLRMKIIIDDGTGAMSAIVNRAITEKLTGVTLAQAIEYAAENGESSVSKLLGDRILLRSADFRGNIMSDEYGPSMIVKDASPSSRDVEKETEALLSTVEEAIM
jgi:replication factor A1